MLLKSLAALIVAFTMISTSALADHVSNSIDAEVDTLLPTSMSAEMCVDTQPLNDGYGWNGTCTCRLPGSYEQFGNSMITDGNRVIIGSEESPNSCQGSGTASVYQIQADGTLEKEAELVSSARESRDAFALSSNDFSLSGDYLAVGTTGKIDENSAPDFNRVTVFSFDGSSWNEHYVKELADFVSQPFSIHGDELFAVLASNEISRFNINDGSAIQTISLTSTCQRIHSFDVIDDLLTINLYCGQYDTEIFRKSPTGEYLPAATFDSSFNTRFKLSKMPDGRNINLGSRRTDRGWQILSMLETENYSWTQVLPLEIESPKTFKLFEGQLFVEDDTFIPTSFTQYACCFIDFIRVYELDTAGNKWVQTQTLNYHSDSAVGSGVRMEFSGNKLSVVRSPNNSLDVRPMDATVSLFEKDNANQWTLVFEQDFTGPTPYTDGGRDFTSSTFAGNSLLLSVMNNEVKNIRFEPGQTSNNTGNAETGMCDYSNAGLFNGWGWNATTQSSCPPIEAVANTNACDYSNAALHDGWGWNSETRESCPPVESDNTNITVVNSACDYSNAKSNNGWGWNSETLESCPPLEQTNTESSNCDYSDAALNGGWGWNAITMLSCSP